MSSGADPYEVLGVKRGASEPEIHAAYRDAVRRTHPDAGGSSAAFEAVQDAYDTLRDPARRARLGSEPVTPVRPRASAPDADRARRNMEDLLAESRRLEDEARRLAGLPPRYSRPEPGDPEPEDSFGAVLRDAGTQLRDAADQGSRELRKLVRRWL